MQARVRRALLRHYAENKRDLPWRGSSDPYEVWISEIMLQQTRAATVAGRYQRFLERFPTVEALASASTESVCEEWAGLGYYGRARRLHEAARTVVERFGGALPTTAAELRELPGIGRYTAAAIASIAFGQSEAVVDGNVTRVFSRLYALDAAPGSATGRRRLWELAQSLVGDADAGTINQALMDLGATICTPRSPRCSDCPVSRWCEAHRAGDEDYYPRAAAKPSRSELPVAMAWIRDTRGVRLERRPLHGLWAGQWQLPAEEGLDAERRLEMRLGTKLGAPLATIRHELTHRTVTGSVYAIAGELPRAGKRGSLAAFADPLAAPLSGLARRAISAVLSASVAMAPPGRRAVRRPTSPS